MEIRSRDELAAYLAGYDGPLRRLRLQSVQLPASDPLIDELLTRDVEGMVVLGDTFTPPIEAALARQGALLFPTNPRLPFDAFRSRLYQPGELYEGLADGYPTTLDARCYRWSQAPAGQHDIAHNVFAALHDTAITDALSEALETASAPTVAVMGGHAVARGTDGYREAALLGRMLAERFAVLSGGGPGAMEAVNLGAASSNAPAEALQAALDTVARVPDFADIQAWAQSAFTARDGLLDSGADDSRSLGIPTWYYGHEPPNVFASRIAKYFSNALREDILLAKASALVVLPGAAGTVQEIFQATVRNYYSLGTLVPTVLVGREHWTERLPAWPLLAGLADGRPMADAIHLVDDVAEAARIVGIDDAPRP